MCFLETHLTTTTVDEVFVVGGAVAVILKSTLFKGCSILLYNLKMYELKKKHFATF